MLIIRDSQIQAFIPQTDEDLIKLVCDAVKKSNSERVKYLSPARFVLMASMGIERAKQAGVTRPEDIAPFVALMFEISPKFYRHPHVAAVLADANYTMAERIAQLPERVTDEQWAEICLAYDPKFWFPDEV